MNSFLSYIRFVYERKLINDFFVDFITENYTKTVSFVDDYSE